MLERASDGVDLGDENTYTLQGSARWTPTEALTFTLRGDYTNEDENGSPFVFNGINERQTFPAAASVRAGCSGGVRSAAVCCRRRMNDRCAKMMLKP